ncbi:MAG: sigma-70 family RNA polymerase sigma factor [Acetatifactor muris]|nr:sigma-70 family RNA polymerase sigma factor [Acetatifactor muris]
MRGKKPKEREKYVIRMGDGTLVEVSREIYLEWHQSERRERYQRERDRKYGLCSMEKLYENGYFPEQSINIINTVDTTQEAVLKNESRDKLKIILQNLPEQDALLIKFLYFKEITIKQTAQIFHCSRKTIQSRRKQILEKIRKMMEET